EYLNGYKSGESMLSADADYLGKVRKIADKIADFSEEKPIVLLSGPSGSGKTTTAAFLEKFLDENGHEAHTVSLDNYFRTVYDHERETIDFESPSRVDGELLSEHIKLLSECGEVNVPVFDFVNAVRTEKRVPLKRKHGEIIIFEGIHALNPETVRFGDESTVKIYVSVRTRISDGFEVFEPKYIRLLRRMCRDKLFRGRDIRETLYHFDSVEDGEVKYIMPYKYRADFSIDSFIPYELGVYKTDLYSDLLQIKDDDRISLLKRLLKEIGETQPETVPENSLIREFIG
ncbi:MAG TPA: nucleoside kinase, partial [Clostridiales bacterium]|nr:nucleoside kinase [Clostridiales bacterium]